MTEYFKKQLDLLHIERREDLRSYLELTEKTSVADRRASGLTWYPVAIRNTEIGRGDYLTVELERTTHTDILHQFRTGSSATLFSNHDPDNRIEGTIAYQSDKKLKLSLRVDELPDWADKGKLGVDLLFDNASYDEMEAALKSAAALVETREGELIRVLTGLKSPSFNTQLPALSVPELNPFQQEAVNKILSAQHLAVVHGPPGTGKTTTLVQAIKALAERDKKQILVVAPSNAAVDLLTEKLADEGLNVLRVGNPARVSPRLASLTLDGKMSEHSQIKEVKKLKKQAGEFRNMAHKYKRNFGKAERDQRKALFDESHKILKDADKIEQFVIDDLFEKAQIITATPVGANHYTVRNRKYETVIIDEAGQALEPACWIPILKAEKVVLAGDHCQLPPTIKSDEASKKGLGVTLFEKCIEQHPEAVVLLEEQYRMNTSIMAYSSQIFYGNKLKAHASVAEQRLFSEDPPLEFIDTAGCGFDEKSEGTGMINSDEAMFLRKHLLSLVNRLSSQSEPEDFPSIAVIAPYRHQIDVLLDLLNDSPELQPYREKISINTVDSFQGQERDVVYISMTRSNTEGKIGFLADIRRMNVAMTRARKKLVIVGDSATLSIHTFYSDFIAHAESLNAYRSAWDMIFEPEIG